MRALYLYFAIKQIPQQIEIRVCGININTYSWAVGFEPLKLILLINCFPFAYLFVKCKVKSNPPLKVILRVSKRSLLSHFYFIHFHASVKICYACKFYGVRFRVRNYFLTHEKNKENPRGRKLNVEKMYII